MIVSNMFVNISYTHCQ